MAETCLVNEKTWPRRCPKIDRTDFHANGAHADNLQHQMVRIETEDD